MIKNFYYKMIQLSESAILFGLLMIYIHNKYEKDLANELKEIEE